MKVSRIVWFLICLIFSTLIYAQESPPYTDYCALLACDIQGKQHGFLSGNLMYYIGGQSSVTWNTIENETIGFTHPFFRDGRTRGHGIVTNRYGTGHDEWGWEFWRQVRGAYGTVLINGQRFPYPVPVEMIWRPDRQICRYQVAGVNIEETKFISLNDIVCSIITADQPVILEFDGHSYVNPAPIPTFDHDPAHTPFSQERQATARYDQEYNVIHIVEAGTAMVKPNWGEQAVEGKMMYDGLNVVISASADLSKAHTLHRDQEGRQAYTFQVPCDARGITLVYAIAEDYRAVVERIHTVLTAPRQAMSEKTDYLNELLNHQIPYFRCSDPKVVATYYYLWALYFMYFADIGKGWEAYPHTQTAINNFMGLHIWDSSVYVRMGTWVADKKKYGYGNLLAWKAMLPFKNDQNMLPDNFGIAWWSPVWQHFEHVAEGAWPMYEQSGDREFLMEAYRFLKQLYWEGGPRPVFGFGNNLLQDFISMAAALDFTEDVLHWQSLSASLAKEYLRDWERTLPDYYGDASVWKDSWHLAFMMNRDLPDEWVDRFVRRWVMNTETGFMGPIPLENRPPDVLENGVFAVSTLASYQAIEGMFRHHRDAEAIHCLLGHINGMVKDYGFPVAPETWDPDYKPWGDQYYNWDGAIVLPVIQRLTGIHFSLSQGEFTVTEHLPKSWNFIESYIPVAVKGKTNWVRVNINRENENGRVHKKISVTGNPLHKLIFQPWLEDRKLLSEGMKSPSEVPRGHIRNMAQNPYADSIQLELGENEYDFPLLVYVKPLVHDFVDSVDVELIGLMAGSHVYYTLDEGLPTPDSPPYITPIRIRETSTVTVRAFRSGDVPGPAKSITYRKIIPMRATAPIGLVPGLHYSFYEGVWKNIPDFDKMQPIKSGITPNFNIAVSPKDEEFGVVFTGYIKIPADGIYTFHTRSNDGSRIYIDDSLVVDLNVWIDHFDPLDKYGSIALRKGFHSIKVAYYQDYGRKHLEIFYEGPGLPKQYIPGATLFHQP